MLARSPQHSILAADVKMSMTHRGDVTLAGILTPVSLNVIHSQLSVVVYTYLYLYEELA